MYLLYKHIAVNKIYFLLQYFDKLSARLFRIIIERSNIGTLGDLDQVNFSWEVAG